MENSAIDWLEKEMQKTYIFNQDDFDMFKKAKEIEEEYLEKLKDFDTWKEWKNS